jgi:hypothetical protein
MENAYQSISTNFLVLHSCIYFEGALFAGRQFHVFKLASSITSLLSTIRAANLTIGAIYVYAFHMIIHYGGHASFLTFIHNGPQRLQENVGQ